MREEEHCSLNECPYVKANGDVRMAVIETHLKHMTEEQTGLRSEIREIRSDIDSLKQSMQALMIKTTLIITGVVLVVNIVASIIATKLAKDMEVSRKDAANPTTVVQNP